MDENEIRKELAPFAAARFACSYQKALDLIAPRAGEPTYSALFSQYGSQLFQERQRLGLVGSTETVEGTQEAMLSWAMAFFKSGDIKSGETCVAGLKRYLAEKVGMFAINYQESKDKAQSESDAWRRANPLPAQPSGEAPGWDQYTMPLLSESRVEALMSKYNPTYRYRGEPMKVYFMAEWFAFKEKELGHLVEGSKEWAYAESDHPFFRQFPSAGYWVEYRMGQAETIQRRLGKARRAKGARLSR